MFDCGCNGMCGGSECLIVNVNVTVCGGSECLIVDVTVCVVVVSV